jgi:hypothetical protein
MLPIEALYLGFLPSHIGIAFRSMALLDAAGQGAAGELAARVAARIAELRAGNPQTLEAVNVVDALLARHALPRPARPHSLAEFIAWAGATSTAAGAAVGETPVAEAALLIGAFLGDLAAATAIGRLTLELLALAPDHAALVAAAERTAHQVAQATDRLAAVLRHPACPAAMRATAEAAVAAARHTAAIDGAEPIAARQAQLRALADELDRCASGLKAAL